MMSDDEMLSTCKTPEKIIVTLMLHRLKSSGAFALGLNGRAPARLSVSFAFRSQPSPLPRASLGRAALPISGQTRTQLLTPLKQAGLKVKIGHRKYPAETEAPSIPERGRAGRAVLRRVQGVLGHSLLHQREGSALPCKPSALACSGRGRDQGRGTLAF